MNTALPPPRVALIDPRTGFISREWYAWFLSLQGVTSLDTGGDGDKGDITVSGGNTIWTIDPAAITYAKIQSESANTLLGRGSTAGSPSEIACTQAGRDLLDDADNIAQRATLGLGSAATYPASSFVMAADLPGFITQMKWNVD